MQVTPEWRKSCTLAPASCALLISTTARPELLNPGIDPSPNPGIVCQHSAFSESHTWCVGCEKSFVLYARRVLSVIRVMCRVSEVIYCVFTARFLRCLHRQVVVFKIKCSFFHGAFTESYRCVQGVRSHVRSIHGLSVTPVCLGCQKLYMCV